MSPPRVLCIGACHWDIIGRAAAPVSVGDDLPGSVLHRPGGVAVNVARAVGRAGLSPVLLSAVGRDQSGGGLLARLTDEAIDTRFILRLTDAPTGFYVAVEDERGLIAAVADTSALDAAGAAILAPLRDGTLASAGRPFAGAAVIDGNLDPELLSFVVNDPGLRGADLRIVPASPAKAARLRPLLGRTPACLCLNRLEAEALCGEALADATAAVQALLARGVRRAIVSDGARPAAEASAGETPVTAAPPGIGSIAHVTGAGDTLLAAHLAAELSGAGRIEALSRAVAAGAAHVAGDPMPFPAPAPSQDL